MTGLSEEERARLDRDGYLVLNGLFERRVLAAMREAVERALERAAADPLWRPGGTLHVDLDVDPAFEPVKSSSRLRAAVTELLGPGWRHTHLSLRAPQPGYGAQVLHGAAALSPEKRVTLMAERPLLVTTSSPWSTSPPRTAPPGSCPARTASGR